MAHVVVVVLGDLGRSPRMQYHSWSLMEMDSVAKVTMIGYRGEKLINDLSSNEKLRVTYIDQPKFVDYFRFIRILHALMKGVGLLWSLCGILASLPHFQLLLLQNPPALPVLFACAIISLFRKFRILLDWHNLGFSMYEHSIGKDHALTRFSRFLEERLCHIATNHICVSKAMQSWLSSHFSIQATVCYDRPAQIFSQRNLPDDSRDQLLRKLGFMEKFFVESVESVESNDTIQTKVIDGKIQRKDEPGRVAMAVSSTSWTADEDFGLLFESLLFIESILSKEHKQSKKIKRDNNAFDRLLVVITGKGELKASFEQRVAEAVANHQLGRFVFVRTAWLESQDYPVLLRCADIGISLHASTSGIDLPMKVVDMFGAGLPVCALDFPTLSELVVQDHNGLIFRSHRELSDQLLKVIFNTVVLEDNNINRIGEQGSQFLAQLRKSLQHFESWNTNWNREVKPIVLGVIGDR